jgi:hypothetical protein
LIFSETLDLPGNGNGPHKLNGELLNAEISIEENADQHINQVTNIVQK